MYYSPFMAAKRNKTIIIIFYCAAVVVGTGAVALYWFRGTVPASWHYTGVVALYRHRGTVPASWHCTGVVALYRCRGCCRCCVLAPWLNASTGAVGKVNRPTIFFYLAVAVVGAKISFIKSLSIFMKRETLQIRHKQSIKHVFRLCMHSYMYITKVT